MTTRQRIRPTGTLHLMRSLLFWGPFSLSLLASAALAESTRCVSCHADKIAGNYVHGPVAVEQCMTCHVATGKPHPGTASMKLTGSRSGLCTYCHDRASISRGVHSSAVAGNCVQCHDPHSSNKPFFLKEQ